MYCRRYALFNICCEYGRVLRRIYRCLLLTVSTYFRGLVRLSALLVRDSIFFSITLYVCSGGGRSAKQKAEIFLPCESI